MPHMRYLMPSIDCTLVSSRSTPFWIQSEFSAEISFRDYTFEVHEANEEWQRVKSYTLRPGRRVFIYLPQDVSANYFKCEGSPFTVGGNLLALRDKDFRTKDFRAAKKWDYAYLFAFSELRDASNLFIECDNAAEGSFDHLFGGCNEFTPPRNIKIKRAEEYACEGMFEFCELVKDLTVNVGQAENNSLNEMFDFVTTGHRTVVNIEQLKGGLYRTAAGMTTPYICEFNIKSNDHNIGIFQSTYENCRHPQLPDPEMLTKFNKSSGDRWNYRHLFHGGNIDNIPEGYFKDFDFSIDLENFRGMFYKCPALYNKHFKEVKPWFKGNNISDERIKEVIKEFRKA